MVVFHIQQMVYTTLSHAPQGHLGGFNILFQSLSLLMFVVLFVFKNKVRTLFNGYVALSYLAFAFIQNMAVTERYGFSVVTVNLVMFLFVAYVWIRETLNPKNTFDFSNLRWKYAWMIAFALFAYCCPFTNQGTFDWNPLHFFYKNSVTAFCLTTPAFLTILTLNIPKINIVTYRITAIIGTCQYCDAIIKSQFRVFELRRDHDVSVQVGIAAQAVFPDDDEAFADLRAGDFIFLLEFQLFRGRLDQPLGKFRYGFGSGDPGRDRAGEQERRDDREQ